MRYDANHGVVKVNAGDVINVIPAQASGKVDVAAGLTNAKVWCPIDQWIFLIEKDSELQNPFSTFNIIFLKEISL